MFPGKNQLRAIECAELMAAGYHFGPSLYPWAAYGLFPSQSLGTSILRVSLQNAATPRALVCELSTLALASGGAESLFVCQLL